MPKSKRRSPSSTKGILKNDNCKKSVLKTRLAKDVRFYKTGPVDDYEKALKECGRLKGNQPYPPSDAAIKANIDSLL